MRARLLNDGIISETIYEELVTEVDATLTGVSEVVQPDGNLSRKHHRDLEPKR